MSNIPNGIILKGKKWTQNVTEIFDRAMKNLSVTIFKNDSTIAFHNLMTSLGFFDMLLCFVSKSGLLDAKIWM